MNAKLLHGKNVANFEILISYLISFEDNYKPPDNELQISHLQEILKKAEESLQLVRFYKIIYENIYDSINIQLNKIKVLSNKLVEVLETTNIPFQVFNDVKRLNSIVQNESIKNISEIEKNAFIKSYDNSVISKQQFCVLIENSYRIIIKTNIELLYIIDEDNLIISNLFSNLDFFKRLNSSLLEASINYQNAINNRNTILYSLNAGLVDTAIELRLYIKRCYKSNSKMYRRIRKIQFYKLKWTA